MMGFQEYIGIPWDQLNCWELVRKVQRECFGIDLPVTPERAENFVEKVTVPKPGDILQMKSAPGGPNKHAGVYIDESRVLHTEIISGSLIEDTRSIRFKWRPIQVYRVRRGSPRWVA